MKQIFSLVKSAMLASILFATVFSFTGCSKDDTSASVGVSLNYALSSQATSGQAGNSSNGSGNLSGTYNTSTKVMSYTTAWTNLTGAPVTGGLYTGATGSVGASFAVWSLGSGLGTSGSFTSTTTLNADQQAQLFAGNVYFLLTTTANASGEIRGQVTATAQQ